MSTINFVIIGVGNIGNKYVNLINGFKDAELVAAVDINFNARKAINKLIPFFISIEEFLAAKIPADVVCICTPNGLHAQHSIWCLNAGYHVICEKPVALTTEDVERMMLAEKKQVKEFLR